MIQSRKTPMTQHFSLMIHGGAGALDAQSDPEAPRFLDSIRRVLEQGREILAGGGSAMDAVEACAAWLEDDPLFNAGRGSVLNENGKVEMDAAIMDGRNLAAGAVAGVSNVANPVRLARLVISNSDHVMLIGEGARQFARLCGVEFTADEYFITPKRLEQLRKAQLAHSMALDHDAGDTGKHGTVGAVARDLKGNLAAATSTGGLVNKRWGRVGDSPIIGAGVYADNQTCAVSTTGFGEDFMRTVLAKTISDYVMLQHMDAERAADAGIKYLRRKVEGRGGFIVVDLKGNCAKAFTTRNLIHGWIEKSGQSHCALQ